MNQKTALLKYLKAHPSVGVTQWTAAEKLGILRLSERIRELEREGVKVVRQRMTATGRYGNPVRPMRYMLG